MRKIFQAQRERERERERERHDNMVEANRKVNNKFPISES